MATAWGDIQNDTSRFKAFVSEKKMLGFACRHSCLLVTARSLRMVCQIICVHSELYEDRSPMIKPSVEPLSHFQHFIVMASCHGVCEHPVLSDLKTFMGDARLLVARFPGCRLAFLALKVCRRVFSPKPDQIRVQ